MSNAPRYRPVTAIAILCAASAAHAAATSQFCLAQKRIAHGNLQKCSAGEEAKAVQLKPSDLTKCTTKFRAKLASLNAMAREAGIDCRFVDNGNSITDYDTGLQWMKTYNLDGAEDHENPLDADNEYTWNAYTTPQSAADGSVFTEFLSQLNNCTNDGSAPVFFGFAAHCDWRLPTTAELGTIFQCPDDPFSFTCVDPIFGPTPQPNLYWSSETYSPDASYAWTAGFAPGTGFLFPDLKIHRANARAVRDQFGSAPYIIP